MSQRQVGKQRERDRQVGTRKAGRQARRPKVVGFMPGRAVMSEQGVQEGTEHTPLKGPLIY